MSERERSYGFHTALYTGIAVFVGAYLAYVGYGPLAALAALWGGAIISVGLTQAVVRRY